MALSDWTEGLEIVGVGEGWSQIFFLSIEHAYNLSDNLLTVDELPEMLKLPLCIITHINVLVLGDHL